MSNSNATFVTLLGIYTTQFTSDWQLVISTAAYKFRTTESVSQLTASLGVMSGYAQEADTLVAGIAAGTVKGKDAETQAANIEMLLSAKKMALNSLIAGVEILDQSNLQKAATLDHAGLKKLAGDLKAGADAALSTNLNKFCSVVTAGIAAALGIATGGGSESDIYAALAADLDKAPAASDRTAVTWQLTYSGAVGLPGQYPELTPPTTG